MVDFYLVTPNGTPDWDKALDLAQADDDLDYFVGKIVEAVRDGVLDRDDLTDTIVLNGQVSWVFQDHHGQGDLGSQIISNAAFVKAQHPDVWAALAIDVQWSKGPKVLAGQPDGQV